MVKSKIVLFLSVCIVNTLFAQEIFSKTDFKNSDFHKQNPFKATLNILFLAGSVKGYRDNGDIEVSDDFQFYPYPVFSLDVSYTLDDITLLSKLNFNSGLGVGVNYTLHDITEFQLYYAPEQVNLQTKSKDPLSKESSSSEYETEYLEVALLSLFSSPFSLKYYYFKEKILDDENGFLLELTPHDTKKLQRSNISHKIELLFEKEYQKSLIELKGHYKNTLADGEANSYDEYRLESGLLYSFHKLFYGFELSYTSLHYINLNPIAEYKESRMDYGATLYTGYQINSKSSLYFSFSMQNVDSNIDIYDQKVQFIATGLSYEF